MREAEEYQYQDLGPVSIAEAEALGWCPDEPDWRDDDRILRDMEEEAGMEALAVE